jgi:hypothetical protein
MSTIICIATAVLAIVGAASLAVTIWLAWIVWRTR